MVCLSLLLPLEALLFVVSALPLFECFLDGLLGRSGGLIQLCYIFLRVVYGFQYVGDFFVLLARDHKLLVLGQELDISLQVGSMRVKV